MKNKKIGLALLAIVFLMIFVSIYACPTIEKIIITPNPVCLGESLTINVVLDPNEPPDPKVWPSNGKFDIESNPVGYSFSGVSMPYTFVADKGGIFTFTVKAWGVKGTTEKLGDGKVSESVIVVDESVPDYVCCNGVCYKKIGDGVYEKTN